MADNTNENKIPADSVEIRLLRNNEKAFVPLSTPDAIVYTEIRKDENKEDKEVILTLTDKLGELDATDRDIYENIKRIDGDTTDITSNINQIKDNIVAIEANVSDLYEIKADKAYVESEINRLDENIERIDKNIDEIEDNIVRIDENIDKIEIESARIYIPSWQYLEGEYPENVRTQDEMEKDKEDPHAVYNKHYVDNYMFNKTQTETFIADTIKSQTYNKTEINKRLGDSLRILVHDDESNAVQLFEEYKCQFLNLTDTDKDILYIYYPDMPKYDSEKLNPDFEYRYTKILVYIKTGDNVPSIIVKDSEGEGNVKTLSLNPNSVVEFSFIYMVGNWLISKTVFHG